MADELEKLMDDGTLEKLTEVFERIKEAWDYLTNCLEDYYDDFIKICEYVFKEKDYSRIPPRDLPGKAAHRVSFRAPASTAFRHWRYSVYGKH